MASSSAHVAANEGTPVFFRAEEYPLCTDGPQFLYPCIRNGDPCGFWVSASVNMQ